MTAIDGDEFAKLAKDGVLEPFVDGMLLVMDAWEASCKSLRAQIADTAKQYGYNPDEVQ